MIRSRSLVCLLALTTILSFVQSVYSQEIVDEWRFRFRRPMGPWRQADYDDSNWQKGFGGFGTRDTPGSRVGTTWMTNNIWMRKSFELNEIPAKPALLMHHDEDAEIFINGTKVKAVTGYTTEYKVFDLDDGTATALRKGKNVMALHCRQTGGGQFIDVHLIDANNVPKLPEAKRQTKPFESELITTWGEKVTPENAWTEYPRPQMQRDNWTNLNGTWQYAITPREQMTTPTEWAGEILVPFCLESKLGGVQRLLDSSETLWYRRTFAAEPLNNEKLLLTFEAVDYRTEVFVNGLSVGQHTGGNTPFTFDISKALRKGENELIVRVEDDTEEWQLRGKQVLVARGIWYTQVSGIWQTVWLERVPQQYIRDVKICPNAKDASVCFEIDAVGEDVDELFYEVSIEVEQGLFQGKDGRGSSKLVINHIPNPRLWTPDDPYLYPVKIRLRKNRIGEIVDEVDSYVGIRDVGKMKDTDGHWRFTLNGERIFHWGPLDQGWWPDGLLTPPSDEGMLFDIEWLKQAGFNMIRKHIKVEPRRYYYHCDRLGMLVWQDQVSAGHNPPWTRLQPNPQDADWPDEQHEQFMLEFERMIDNLENHPSIVVWIPFNEAWGQHRTVETGKWAVERDPSRLINVASGGNFWPVGDIVDQHAYPHPTFPFELDKNGRFDPFVKVMGEFGGHGYPVRGHLWDADRRNWGYGGLPQTKEEYKERYVTSLKMLKDLRDKGISGGVYTQTTDVEGEINGLMTYDRKVIKIPAEELAELHKMLE